ncbi:MAG: hypothetical protein WB870_02830 [Gallionellaceae bacterium]
MENNFKFSAQFNQFRMGFVMISRFKISLATTLMCPSIPALADGGNGAKSNATIGYQGTGSQKRVNGPHRGGDHHNDGSGSSNQQGTTGD